jgi:putative addiction module component (TIGR02574 family)
MSIPRERLEAEALDLPTEERARLVRRLIQSLDGEPEEPGKVALAWQDEIRRRLGDLEAGRLELIPAEVVLEKARRRVS